LKKRLLHAAVVLTFIVLLSPKPVVGNYSEPVGYEWNTYYTPMFVLYDPLGHGIYCTTRPWWSDSPMGWE